MRSIASYLIVISALYACTSDDAVSGDGAPVMATRQVRDAGSRQDNDTDASTSPPKPSTKADAGRSTAPMMLDAGIAGHARATDGSMSADAESDAAPAAASGDASSPTNAPAASDDIETVVMDLVYVSDLSGNLTPDARPVILFKDGWACRDMNFVVQGVDAATHRAMYPNKWQEWSVVDTKIALKNSKGNWSSVYYQLRYPPNSSSLTFEETFTRLLTGVNVALGTSAVSQKDIHLWNDHRIVIGSYVGLTTPDTVTQAVPPESRGTYQIDGYTIEIEWDDGKTQKTSFVFSDKDPGAIYVGGSAYVDLKN